MQLVYSACTLRVLCVYSACTLCVTSNNLASGSVGDDILTTDLVIVIFIMSTDISESVQRHASG